MKSFVASFGFALILSLSTFAVETVGLARVYQSQNEDSLLDSERYTGEAQEKIEVINLKTNEEEHEINSRFTLQDFVTEQQGKNKYFEDEILSLRIRNENLQVANNILQETIKKGYTTLDNGWIGMFNGYKYKVTHLPKSYEESKILCKGMGANLAVHGVQDIQSRKTLKRALNLVGDKWIGLNDKGVEGFWRWENGDYASASTALWYPFYPDGGNRENCAYIWFDQTQLSNDISCATRHYAICEKKWN